MLKKKSTVSNDADRDGTKVEDGSKAGSGCVVSESCLRAPYDADRATASPRGTPHTDAHIEHLVDVAPVVITMITRKQFFRAVQTIAVPVLLGLIVRWFWGDHQEPKTPPSQYYPLLADIDFVPRKLPVTYRVDVPEFDAYERVSILLKVAAATAKPDVTAVLLNWSRFPNVLLITSLLCGAWLEGTIAEVFVWNNSPRKLTYEVCILFFAAQS